MRMVKSPSTTDVYKGGGKDYHVPRSDSSSGLGGVQKKKDATFSHVLKLHICQLISQYLRGAVNWMLLFELFSTYKDINLAMQ